jgi:hypothetical protein
MLERMASQACTALRARADGHGPRLRALAGHGHFALRRIIGQVQSNELADAQPGRVEKLEHRGVLDPERGRFTGAIQKALRAFYGKSFWQRPRRLGRADTEHRVRRESAVARKPAKIAAPCRERERKRAGRESFAMELGDVTAHFRGLHALERLVAAQSVKHL